MTAIALTIAGSDSGGGAGIQADLKTFSALGVFGTSVITAITAQNTMGVRAVEDVSPDMIAAQLDAVLDDIAVGAVKIGMVSRVETITVIADRLRAWTIRPVFDPVMIATSGDPLLRHDAIDALCAQLLPLAAIVTPNLPEAALLTKTPIADDESGMIAQGEAIMRAGASAVLIKGGHGSGSQSTDILFDGQTVVRLSALRIATRNTHGTGCTLAAAITAGLAKGLALHDAVENAKTYLSAALGSADRLAIGKGSGPVHHFHHWWQA